MPQHITGGAQVRIVPYEDRHAGAFRDLNLDWIQEYFVVEDKDRALLFAPRAEILDSGGAIRIVERDGLAIGCCALLNHGQGVFEVSKMAVARDSRNLGIGRVLLLDVIQHGTNIGAHKLTIISNTVLGPAIHLYKALGFREVPLESQAYARGNIALELTVK